MKKDITLVAIDFLTHDLTKLALEKTISVVDPKEVVVVSDRNILLGSTWVPAKPVSGMEEYATLMLKWTWPLIDTSHALYVQWDGMATNADLWTDEFLKYDYIGAPWPWKEEGVNVGNGGFSLRSHKLLHVCGFDSAIQLTAQEPIAEDNIIGQHNRAYLEHKYGIKYAPTALAEQFSFELGESRDSFGFHGIWNMPARLTSDEFAKVMPHLNFERWNIHKWHHFIVALANAGHEEHLQTAMTNLEQYSPDLIEPLNQWLESEGFKIVL
jgi:hypothetical protein